MRKYWALVKTSLQSSLTYRVDFLLWGMNELLDTLVFLFIWIIIFGERQSIGGFTLPETITYLIGVGLVGNITYTWISSSMEDDIRTGKLSGFLTKPASYPLMKVMTIISEKPVDTLIRISVYIIIAIFFRGKFIINTSFLSWFFLIISILLAYLLSNLISFCLGCIAFWITSVNRGITGLSRTFTNIFSGSYAPLTFFPIWFQGIARLLPFSYTRYFPMQIYLKKIPVAEILLGLGIQIIWVIILYFLAKLLWRRGIKKYEGVGI